MTKNGIRKRKNLNFKRYSLEYLLKKHFSLMLTASEKDGDGESCSNRHTFFGFKYFQIVCLFSRFEMLPPLKFLAKKSAKSKIRFLQSSFNNFSNVMS